MSLVAVALWRKVVALTHDGVGLMLRIMRYGDGQHVLQRCIFKKRLGSYAIGCFSDFFVQYLNMCRVRLDLCSR